jgi:hypothetical protein
MYTLSMPDIHVDYTHVVMVPIDSYVKSSKPGAHLDGGRTEHLPFSNNYCCCKLYNITIFIL